jgi:hypothetical protein
VTAKSGSAFGAGEVPLGTDPIISGAIAPEPGDVS